MKETTFLLLDRAAGSNIVGGLVGSVDVAGGGDGNVSPARAGCMHGLRGTPIWVRWQGFWVGRTGRQ